MTNSAVLISNLSISHQKLLILKNINLDVQEGQWIEIIGQNNSGKSSLLRALFGYKSELQGTIKVLGITLNPMSEEFQLHKRKIGFLSNDFPLISGKTLRANLSLALSATGNSTDLESDHWCREVLMQLNLDKKLTKLAETLSSSEKIFSQMARALISSPTLLLIDDILCGLDDQNKERAYNLLKQFYDKEKCSVISVLKSVSEKSPIGKKVFVIEKSAFRPVEI